jgi:tetratricopeptide (TPR) repeat protein
MGIARSCWRGVALVAVLLACGSVARAASKDREARRLYDEATAAFGLGHYAEAAEKYEGAFALRPDPALLYNAAQAYRVAGNKPRALELYRNYLRLYADRSNAADARNHVAALEKAIEDEKTPPAAAAPPPPAPAPAVTAPPPAPLVAAAPPPPAPVAPAAPPGLVATPAPAAEPQPPPRNRTWIWIAAGAAVLVGGTVAVLLATRGTNYPDPTLGTAPGN